MDEHMAKDSKDLADTPNTSAIKTEVLEDVHEELYASSVKTEILEDDQQDLCSSAVKTEVSEDVPQEFYFCAVDMDGLEDAEFKEKMQNEQLELDRLMVKRQHAAERQRKYKARKKILYEEKLKAMFASSQKECNEQSLTYLEQEAMKKRIKRQYDTERQRRYRAAKRLKEKNLKAMTISANENSSNSPSPAIAYLSESAIKPEVSVNVDPIQQELDRKMEKRKRDAERQRRYRQAKKFEEEQLKVMIASTTSSSQSSTDESQNDLEWWQRQLARVSQKESQKELKKIPFGEDYIHNEQSVGAYNKERENKATHQSESVTTQNGLADVSRKNVGSNLIENLKEEETDSQDEIV